MKKFKTRNEMFSHFEKGLKIVELGVFRGEFSKIIYEICNPSELYLVDLFDGIFTSGDKDGLNYQTVNLLDEMFSIIESFSENPNVTVVKSSTIEFLLSKEDEYFDLVYIDADHSYDGVLNDLELSYKKVKRNGFICGHDYISGTACANAVNNFCNSKNLSIEYITEDGCPSFCIVKK
jgi:hypothetical protein